MEEHFRNLVSQNTYRVRYTYCNRVNYFYCEQALRSGGNLLIAVMIG